MQSAMQSSNSSKGSREPLSCANKAKKTRPTFSGYSDHAMLNLTKEIENKKMQM
jgi:hypothetical protein